MDHPLRLYRFQSGQTVDALARELGISKASLSRIENGLQAPSFDLVKRIAARTTVMPNELLAFSPKGAAA